MMPQSRYKSGTISRERGFSLLEAIVALTILLAGILAIIMFFPETLVSARQAEMRTKATVLAQMKAEEIRRDDDTSNTLVNAIKALPVPTAPITFAQDRDLAYQFSGQSLLYSGETPAGDPNIARVIIRYSPEFRTSPNPNKDVLYELRFGP
jgi:type II secretory pathway pseudopilin PulG